MTHKARLAALVLLTLYVIAGNLLGCMAFIFGFDAGDPLFFAFYPCTVFWAVAYFTGPLWMIGGVVIAAVQLWVVFKVWEAFHKKTADLPEPPAPV